MTGITKMISGFKDKVMNDRIKKEVRDAFEDFFLPAFMFTWAIGLGVGSFILVISTLWKVFSFF